MSGGEGKLQNITRDEWRRGENYRTLLEMSGWEGKLQNISGEEQRIEENYRTLLERSEGEGKTTEQYYRGVEERDSSRTLLMSGGEEQLQDITGEEWRKGNISWIYNRGVEERNTFRIY
jgi:hypothetical protein